jgi:tetratricopeptide (TPR) repeat protein
MIRALLAVLLLLGVLPSASNTQAAAERSGGPEHSSPPVLLPAAQRGTAAFGPLPAILGRPASLLAPAVTAPAVALPGRPLGQTLSNAESRAVESARDGRYSEAIALTSQLIDREPDRLNSRLIRAMSYYYSAQLPEALHDLDYALDRVPDGTGRTLRALVHLELGNYATAVADALEALTSPDLPVENLGAAYLTVGRVLLARGQSLEAGAYLQKVLDLPDTPNVRTARVALELLSALPAAPGGLTVRDANNGYQVLRLPARTVQFQGDDGVTAAGAASIAGLLDARLAAVAALTGVGYSGPVHLILYKSGWELERALGGQYRGPGLSRALRQGVRGADGTWRQYVHVAATDPSLLFDLTHEAAHLVQAEVGLDDSFGTVPAWLIEGHAEHVALATLQDVAPASVRLRLTQRHGGVSAASRAGRLLPLRSLESFADWGRAQARDAEQTYGQALYAAALLGSRYGFDAALRIVATVQAGAPFDAAFLAVTGVPAEAFYADALSYTQDQAVSAPY